MKREKIEFIKRVVSEIGGTTLSSRLGKYFYLVDNGVTIVAIALSGEYGYEATPIEKLPGSVVDLIYDDLKVDFE